MLQTNACDTCVNVLDGQTLQDVRRIIGDAQYTPSDPRQLCRLLFTTCYMASDNSSHETRQHAHDFAQQIGRFGCSLRVRVRRCCVCEKSEIN